LGKLEKGFAAGAILAAFAVGGVLYAIYPNMFTPNYATPTTGQSYTTGQTTTAAQNTQPAQTNSTSNSTGTSSQNSTGTGQSGVSGAQSSGSGY